MRLCFCYSCRTLSKIDDYDGGYHDDGEPISDHLLENWIARHMHGLSEDDHPGGRVFPFEGRDIEVEGGRLDGVRVDVANEIEAVRSELSRAGVEVQALRDELREDAHSCFIKHKRPMYPDRKCIDYHDDAKWLGRRIKVDGERINVRQGYLCSFCPYETAVSIARRGFN
jgi:hypothetical protein